MSEQEIIIRTYENPANGDSLTCIGIPVDDRWFGFFYTRDEVNTRVCLIPSEGMPDAKSDEHRTEMAAMSALDDDGEQFMRQAEALGLMAYMSEIDPEAVITTYGEFLLNSVVQNRDNPEFTRGLFHLDSDEEE